MEHKEHKDYTVGWICALPVEASVAIGMLDVRHESLPSQPTDDNQYTFGQIGTHDVVIACLPAGVTGPTSAATVATQVRSTFTSLRFGLLVGIGGGVPSAENDIRLGDIVISKPTGTSGGVIQYDFGKTVQQGRFERTGSLNRPPDVLLKALSNLQARHMLEEAEFSRYLSKMVSKYPKLEKSRKYPGVQHDQLFEPNYDHQAGTATCVNCELDRLVSRSDREDEVPVVHYGTVASGNQVMRDGITREKLRKELDVLCFEMEAAGLMDTFPCLVIRGVCDYADSHKNKLWQPYAAATAAAYAKELLCIMPGHQIVEMQLATTTVKPLFSVPYPRDSHFIERKEIFSRVENQLQKHHRVSLWGWGGVGKSQIAIEYAYRFRQLQPRSHIFWIYAASSARITQAYEDISRQLKLPGSDHPNTDSCEKVSKWLNEEDSHWLMILDNADNADIFSLSTESDAPSISTTQDQRRLEEYLPRNLNSRKSIIITTRSRSLGMDVVDEESCVEVKSFSFQEAEDLLRLKLQEAGEYFDMWTTKRLLKTLGYIPLAITQAAAFINRTPITVQSYLAALEKDEQNLKDFLSKDLQDHRRQRGFPNSVFRTWEVSFKQILKRDPLAAELLSMAAMLDPQRIPQKLLERLAKKDIDFWTAIGTLTGFALITKELKRELYTIHPLVRASVHYWLERRSEKNNYISQALRLLAEEFPDGEHENTKMCESMLAHAQAVFYYDCVSEDDLKHRAALLYKVGKFDWRQCRYLSAYQEALEAYNINQKQSGESAYTTLDSLSLLGSVVQSQGQYEAAEKMQRRAINGWEKVLGVEHPETMASLSNLALVIQKQGKYDVAEELHRRALNRKQKVLGVEHPETLTSLSNLASVLQDQGKYKAAEEMNRRALDGRQKVLGVEHPEALTSLSNLALVLQDQGKYEAAEEINRRALNGFKNVLGVEHPDTLTSVYNLAYLFHTQKRYKEASVIYLRASEGFLKVLGPDHRTTRECSQEYSSMVHEMKGQVKGREG